MSKLNFVLSSGGDDAILAAKIVCAKNENAIHLSSGRKNRIGEYNESVMFIRCFKKPGYFLDQSGPYREYNVTIVDFQGSDLHDAKTELEAAGIKCVWADNNETLAEAVWRYCNNNEEYPAIIKYVRDYMKWELKLPNSIHMHYGMSTIENKMDISATSLYTALLNDDQETVFDLIRDGIEIEQYLESVFEVLRAELVFESDLGGRTILAANIHGVNSKFFPESIALSDCEATMIFSYIPYTNKIRHTLFALNNDVHVNDIAKEHGGNGSEGVSAFSLDKLVIDRSSYTIQSVDHSKLVMHSSMSTAVASYIRNNLHVGKFAVNFCKYKGRDALIANTPFLTEENMFSKFTGSYLNPEAILGVTFCLQASQQYRIAVCNLQGTDPGEEFGELVGIYRISVQHELMYVSHPNMKKDVFTQC